MVQEPSLIKINKQQLVFSAILGPALALLIGIVIGIAVVEDDEMASDSLAKILLQEITVSNLKKYHHLVNSVTRANGDDALVERVVTEWSLLLDKVEVSSSSETGRKISKSVVGYLFGSEEKDRFVILGNHRNMNNSGTPIIMELVRAFGQVAKSGTWRPRRTIVFCSFVHVKGNNFTEWLWSVEKILPNTVVYFDIDRSVEGNGVFSAGGTPNLKWAVFETAQVVQNPDAGERNLGRSFVFDTWLHQNPDKEKHNFPLFEIPFSQNGNQNLMLLKFGVSSVGLRFSNAKSGMALTEVAESFQNSASLDSEYKFSLASSKIWADLTRKFSNEVLLPFSPFEYFYLIEEMVTTLLQENASLFRDHEINTEDLQKVLKRFESTVSRLEKLIENVDGSHTSQIRIINDKLGHFDRSFLDMTTLHKNNQHHHVLFGVKQPNCSDCHHLAKVRSAIKEAKKHGDWTEVSKQISILTFYIDSAATTLSEF